MHNFCHFMWMWRWRQELNLHPVAVGRQNVADRPDAHPCLFGPLCIVTLFSFFFPFFRALSLFYPLLGNFRSSVSQVASGAVFATTAACTLHNFVAYFRACFVPGSCSTAPDGEVSLFSPVLPRSAATFCIINA